MEGRIAEEWEETGACGDKTELGATELEAGKQGTHENGEDGPEEEGGGRCGTHARLYINVFWVGFAGSGRLRLGNVAAMSSQGHSRGSTWVQGYTPA